METVEILSMSKDNVYDSILDDSMTRDEFSIWCNNLFDRAFDKGVSSYGLHFPKWLTYRT
jgi:hypothetical protein